MKKWGILTYWIDIGQLYNPSLYHPSLMREWICMHFVWHSFTHSSGCWCSKSMRAWPALGRNFTWDLQQLLFIDTLSVSTKYNLRSKSFCPQVFTNENIKGQGQRDDSRSDPLSLGQCHLVWIVSSHTSPDETRGHETLAMKLWQENREIASIKLGTHYHA